MNIHYLITFINKKKNLVNMHKNHQFLIFTIHVDIVSIVNFNFLADKTIISIKIVKNTYKKKILFKILKINLTLMKIYNKMLIKP